MRRLARLTGIVSTGILDTLSFADYALRAACLYSSFKAFVPPKVQTATFYDARYGPKPRNVMDIYQPSPQEGSDASSVVLFVHGGRKRSINFNNLCLKAFGILERNGNILQLLDHFHRTELLFV